MAGDDLTIDLRMGFIRRAQQMRPRLPKNLRQLGAVGPVTPAMQAGPPAPIVKVGITHAHTTAQHLSYLTHGKGREGQDATLFGAPGMARQALVAAAQQDPHQFRLVVSTPDQVALDRTQFIEAFMAQVQQDLGRPVDWLAAHHYDTKDPHTHIVLRGRDRDGKDLYMAKHYMTQGLRARASELLTWMTGVKQQQAQQMQVQAQQALDGVERSPVDPDLQQRQQEVVARSAVRDPQSQQQPIFVNVQNYLKDRQRIILRNREQGVATPATLVQEPATWGKPLRSFGNTASQRELPAMSSPRSAPQAKDSLADRLATLRPDQTLMLREHLKLWESKDASRGNDKPETLAARLEQASKWLVKEGGKGRRPRQQDRGMDW